MERRQRLAEAIKLTLEQSRSNGLAEDILQKVVAEAIRAYQAKINVGVQDSVSDLLDGFKHKVTDQILEATDQWHVPQREPILFPKNCRFMYQRGNTTVMVMEEPPQCRTLSFSKRIIASQFVSTFPEVQNLYLALPYVIFVATFQNANFKTLHCAFRNRALDSIDAELGKPLLPNIHDNLEVCMGNSFFISPLVPITQKAEGAINWFWGSTFNKDLSERWEQKHRVDARLADGLAWERLSQEDSLFILTTQFNSASRTIRQIMESAASHEEEPNESDFRHRLADSIEGCADQMAKRILAYLKKTKFERHIPQDVSTSVQTVIAGVMAEVADLALTLQDQVEKLRLESDPSHKKWQARGEFWS